jgi:hypothetical protein
MKIHVILKYCSYLLAIVFVFSGCQYSGAIDYPVSKLFLDTLPTDHESILRINTRQGDLKHGESYLYYPGYGHDKWELYIKDTLLISLVCGSEDSEYGCTYWYFNVSDSTLYPIGSLWYDLNSDERIDSVSNYFEVIARDTIYWGDPIWIRVTGVLAKKTDFKITLRLGEITPGFELVNQYAYYESETREVLFQITDYKLGVNLITGIVNYYEDGEDITQQYSLSEIEFPFVFYKQFVVIKSD